MLSAGGAHDACMGPYYDTAIRMHEDALRRAEEARLAAGLPRNPRAGAGSGLLRALLALLALHLTRH